MASPSQSDVGYDLLMKIQQGTMAYRYRGVPLQKNPFDLALFPLLLAQVRPRTLIEVGSYLGGSALWFADQARLIDLDLRILSIDLDPPSGIAVPNGQFLRGDARSLQQVLPPGTMASLTHPLLVVEDSSHVAETTAAVLAFFEPWLHPGDYIVVEDGILSDMRVADDHYGGGPLRAIDAFLERTAGRYIVDRRFCDYFGTNVTWNVNGYLRRV